MSKIIRQEAAPKLAPVFSLLVVGHENDRLPGEAVERLQLFKKLDEVIGQIYSTVQKKETFTSEFYSQTETPQLRILAGACEGVELEAARISACREIPLHLIVNGKSKQLDNYQKKAERIVNFGSKAYDNSSDSLLHSSVCEDFSLTFADMLVAVWDGNTKNGNPDRTLRMIVRAILARKPIVWLRTNGIIYILKPSQFYSTFLLDQDSHNLEPERITEIFEVTSDFYKVEQIIKCLMSPKDEKSLQLYFNEIAGGVGERILKKRFHNFCSNIVEKVGILIEFILKSFKILFSFFDSVFQHSPKKNNNLEVSIKSQNLQFNNPEFFLSRFKWSDDRAIYAAQAYRNIVWLLYGLASLAVLIAVSGAIIYWTTEYKYLKKLFLITEIFVLIIILIAYLYTKIKKLHKRWLSHRFIAEQLRYASMGYFFLAFPKLFFTPNFGEYLEGEFPYKIKSGELWILHRTLSSEGIPSHNIDFENKENFGKIIQAINHQINYHHNTEKKLHHVHLGMHGLTGTFFFATLVFIVSFWESPWLLIFTAVLPAMGAATHGILTKLEITRLVNQSKITKTELLSLKHAIETSSDSVEFSKSPWLHWLRIRQLTLVATSIMSDETNQWQQLLNEQELALP